MGFAPRDLSPFKSGGTWIGKFTFRSHPIAQGVLLCQARCTFNRPPSTPYPRSLAPGLRPNPR
ncbi:MAG: hypothetical protein AMXMBFR33_38850 [Candidatus Xenobia bacterium]